MSATILEIADAIVIALNAGGFSQPFIATRNFRPNAKLPDMGPLTVTVTPRGVVTERGTRSMVQRDFEIDIAVQQKLRNINEDDEVETLMTLTEEIADAFSGVAIAGHPVLRTSNEPIYHPDHLIEFGQFTSVVTVQVRALK